MSEETQAPTQPQGTEEAPSQPASWRERVESAVEQATAVEDAGESLVQDTRPRDPETGRFIPKEEAATGEPPPEPEADVPHETSEGEEPPEEGVEEESEGGLTVELPPRQEGDEPFQITVQTEEEAQHLRQLTNGYMRKQEFNRQMESVKRDQSELNDIEAWIRADPAGYVVSRMPAGTQAEVAATILSSLDPEAYQAIVGRMVEWERTPQRREMDAFKAEKERYQLQQQLQQKSQQDQYVQSRVQDIRNAVAAIIPQDVPKERADRFYRLAMMELQQHFRSNPTSPLDGSKVPEFLKGTGLLDDYGFGGREPAPSVPRPAKDRPGTQDSAGMSPQERVERRRNASMTTPPGVGAGASSFQDKPEGMTVDEALKWARKRLLG